MQNYGSLNAHNIGTIMKEIVRRVILSIREHRFAMEVSEKRGLGGDMDDMVTNADKDAQEIYVELLRENFPNFGIVAEEEALSIEPKEGFENVYFTVDPLDGTKAFVRQQSQGIGTMIALVADGEVVGAYVGDIMTEEIYGYRPESEKVHRISEFGRAAQLKPSKKDATTRYISLREDPRRYSSKALEIIDKFGGVSVESGSIGIHAARMWKQVVGGMLLPPSHETPWDTAPVIGISKKLGYRFYEIGESGVSEYDMPLKKEIYKRDSELLIAPPGAEKLL